MKGKNIKIIKKINKYLIISLAFAIIIVFLYYISSHSEYARYVYPNIIVTLFILLFILIISFIMIHDITRTNNPKSEIDSLRDRILEKKEECYVASDVSIVNINTEKELQRDNKEKDILELMLENMTEIKKYYQISKNHVRASFILSIITCVVGIVLLAISIDRTLVAEEFNSALVAVIGGAITELFSGTALLVHKNSVKQLNYYYKALHENERYLSTVNLVSKISPEKQDDVYIEVIQNSLAVFKEMAIKNSAAEEKAVESGEPARR